jgi:diacylglycerol O-acyltransferase / wax synthase
MASNPQREPLTAVDRAWLGMDSPVNLMVINTVLLFDEPVDFDRLRNVCGQRLVGRFRRFRQRVVAARGGALFWEDDGDFDLRTHILRIGLPAPGDTHTLQCLISSLVNDRLDSSRPLWRFYLVENYNGGCALVCRIHHAVADGIALVKVLLSLTDECATPSWAEPADHKARAGPWHEIRHAAGELRQSARKMAARGVREFLRTIDDPSYGLESVRAAGLLGAASAAIAAKLLLIPPDRPSVLKGDLGVFKRVVWTEPVPLAQIKAIGARSGATVNDVLMAIVAGGLRRYLQGRGDPVDDGVVRTLVPVNLRSADEPLRLGNQFSLVYLALPVSVDDPKGRLLFVKERMTVLKQSPEPFVTYGVINGLGLLPGDWAQRAVEMFAGKATAVLTNVPGPRQTRYLAGSPIERILFWVPQSGQIGMGISIISYAGQVTVGVMVDEKRAPDAEMLIPCFAAEVAALASEPDA